MFCYISFVIVMISWLQKIFVCIYIDDHLFTIIPCINFNICKRKQFKICSRLERLYDLWRWFEEFTKTRLWPPFGWHCLDWIVRPYGLGWVHFRIMCIFLWYLRPMRPYAVCRISYTNPNLQKYGQVTSVFLQKYVRYMDIIGRYTGKK